MASPVVNNVVTNNGASASYTPSSVSDSILVVIALSEDLSSDDPFTAVDFGASGLTLAVAGAGGPDGVSATQRCEIWYLINPGTTAETISLTGGEASRLGFIALTLSGAAQSTPIDDTGTDAWTSNTTTASPSLTTTVVDTLCLSAMCQGNTGTSTSDATEIADFNISSAGSAAATSDESGTGSVTHTFTFSTNSRGASAIAAFKPAGGGGGGGATIPIFARHYNRMKAA